MSDPTALQVITLVLVTAAGTAVALERNPLHQSLVTGVFGTLLAVLFLVFQAPDVALSEIVVGAVVVPTLVLVTLSKSSGNK